MLPSIIDVPSDVTEFALALREAGVSTVIRYYNHHNSSRLPTKCLTRPELAALHEAGLSVAVVFEQHGGADGELDDLSEENGALDARRALELAAEMEQPAGSGIYFAIDADYFRPAELRQIGAYFRKIKEVVGGVYGVGIYGSGAVARHLQQAGLVDLIWLAGSTGWSGTEAALAEGAWTIFQKFLEKRSEIGGFTYDGNIVNPSVSGFGQFGKEQVHETPIGDGSAALFKVIARSGLNLRAGPGENFRVLDTLAAGTLVSGLRRDGGWIQVDIEGDGQADGFMSGSFLQPISGGLPIAPSDPGGAAGLHPIDVARAELALGVSEIAGAENNPRIVMYHRTTAGGGAPDETSWCSSFVNYCVEQAGLIGTRSKWALSWHDEEWGRDVTADPRQGDIAVFRRRSPTESGGHVGFFLSQDENTVQLLGGNQGNRISIARFPKHGSLGSTHFTLLSIRRG